MWVAIESYNQPGYNKLLLFADTYTDAVKGVEALVKVRHDASIPWSWEPGNDPTYYWMDDGGYDPCCIILYEVKAR